MKVPTISFFPCRCRVNIPKEVMEEAGSQRLMGYGIGFLERSVERYGSAGRIISVDQDETQG